MTKLYLYPLRFARTPPEFRHALADERGPGRHVAESRQVPVRPEVLRHGVQAGVPAAHVLQGLAPHADPQPTATVRSLHGVQPDEGQPWVEINRCASAQYFA